MSEYFTVRGAPECTTVIEKSKFICAIKNVDSEEDARAFIEKRQKEYSLATHHCYAYITDEQGRNFRFSDDGEPQGTAGIPILNVLKQKNLFCTVAVVTRFFGGIKLGTGGLTRAYSNAVQSCFDLAQREKQIKQMNKVHFYETITDYEEYARLLNIIENSGYYLANVSFNNTVATKFAVIEKEDLSGQAKQSLFDAFKGKNVVVKEEIGYYDIMEKKCQR